MRAGGCAIEGSCIQDVAIYYLEDMRNILGYPLTARSRIVSGQFWSTVPRADISTEWVVVIPPDQLVDHHDTDVSPYLGGQLALCRELLDVFRPYDHLMLLVYGTGDSQAETRRSQRSPLVL